MIIFEKDELGRGIFEIVLKNSGSAFAKEGAAFLLSHMLNTKGTEKEKEKFYDSLETDAIEVHVSVNKEYMSFSLRFLNSKKNKALKMLKELILSPNLSEESFVKAKNELKAKIENKKNDNDYLASLNLHKTIFKNTPLMYPVLGENIDSLTLPDIKALYNEMFKKEAIYIIGGIEIDIAEFDFFNAVCEKTPFYHPKPANEIYFHKNVEQSFIHFASPFNIDYKKEMHLAKISTFILGAGGFGSRMMEEIRVKRGYAYSAYAMNNFKKTHKLLNGYLQTKTDNTKEAVALVKGMINDLYENGVTEEELKQAKMFLIGSEPLRNETLAQRLIRKFNETYLNLPENYFAKEPETISEVTTEELNSFIKNHPEIKELTFSIVTKE